MYSHSGILIFFTHDFLIEQRKCLLPGQKDKKKCTLDLSNQLIVQTNFSSHRCSAENEFYYVVTDLHNFKLEVILVLGLNF